MSANYRKPLVDILLPVYNEEHVIEWSVNTVRDFLQKNVESFDWIISIGDNASIDRTLEVSKELEKKYSDVRVLHIDQKGRGRMVKYAWTNSEADVLVYMDVDLSTDLKCLPPLIQAILDGYDIAIGSRHFKGSHLERSIKREIISRGYLIILKLFLDFPFSDAQCGFKAVSKNTVRTLIPIIEDNEWFFDTELLYRGYKAGYKIKEIPVHWIEDKDSRVRIIRTAWLDILGVMRMRKLKL
jgi:glycosyltransferase involved in cell wall biosynthesis